MIVLNSLHIYPVFDENEIIKIAVDQESFVSSYNSCDLSNKNKIALLHH